MKAKNLLLVATVLGALFLVMGGRAAKSDIPPLPQPTIYVVNASTNVSNEEVANALPAFQLATDQDFRGYWNAGAKLVASNSPPRAAWTITLKDWLGNCGCYGYHDVTPGFIPYGKVETSGSPGGSNSWQVVFTHELFELLADPRVNRAVVTPSGRCKVCKFHWLETADPTENFFYTRPGADGQPIQISDFVTERWWDQGAVRGPFDVMGLVKYPLQILPGGYEGTYGGGIHY